jgi:hypothetical protein
MMNHNETKQQGVFLLQSWWQRNKNSACVLEMFAEKFRDTPVPTRQAIYNLNQRFQRHRSVHDMLRSGRPRTSLAEEHLIPVAQALVQSPKNLSGRLLRSSLFLLPVFIEL